ncbi:MAG: hypothetical protein LYZ70_04070 [Nitrososphaerales archaeon]|nr:hypothetical protein [Nitrososphaerales archaeon]
MIRDTNERTKKLMNDALSELEKARNDVAVCPEHSGTDSQTEFEHLDNHIDNAIESLKEALSAK